MPGCAWPEPKRHDFAASETGRGPSVPSNGLANDQPVNGMAGACIPNG